METLELLKIKKYQREFFETFNKKLEIDWNAMNNVIINDVVILHRFSRNDNHLSMDKILIECLNKHNVSLENITNRKKRIHNGGHFKKSSKEKNVLIDFSKAMINNRYNLTKAAKLINRDRTLIYHYAKM